MSRQGGPILHHSITLLQFSITLILLNAKLPVVGQVATADFARVAKTAESGSCLTIPAEKAGPEKSLLFCFLSEFFLRIGV